MLTFGYLLKNKDKKDVIKFLKNYNIKYFLWNRDSSFEKIIWANLPNGSNEYKNLTLNNHEFFLDFKRNNMELITEEGGYYLYKLKEE